MISNKFLIFRTQNGFTKKLGQIPKDSIVFIKDKGLIWTHDQYFGLSTGLEKGKGYFDTYSDLLRKYPNPEIGDWAIIASAVVDGEEKQWVVARCITKGVWGLTAQTYDRESFDLSEYVKKEDLDLSQFITNADLSDFVHKGDINLNLYATKNELYSALQQIIADSRIQVDSELSTTSTHPVQNKVITEELNKKLEESDLDGYTKEGDVRTLINNRILEIINALEENEGDYNIKEEILNERIDELKDLIDEINEKYISWGINEGGSGDYNPTPINSASMITISDEAYQALVDADEVNPNVYYFTYSAADYPEHTTWTFGGTFPITFTEQWAFGGTFPITLQ